MGRRALADQHRSETRVGLLDGGTLEGFLDSRAGLHPHFTCSSNAQLDFPAEIKGFIITYLEPPRTFCAARFDEIFRVIWAYLSSGFSKDKYLH